MKRSDGSVPPDFDSLAQDYARFRSGCPPGPLRVLDVASGTGLSAQGIGARAERVVACGIAPGMLRANPLRDKALARAGALSFRDAAVDLLTCAQAFHGMDPLPAYRQFHRVLRPAGLAVIWWKYEDARDPTARLVEGVLRDALGAAPPHTDMARGLELPGIAESPVGAAEEVRIRHAVRSTADTLTGYHASRENLRRAAGPRREEALAVLARELRAARGSEPFDVAYVDRLCPLRKR